MTSSSDQKYNVPGLDRALRIIELLNERPTGLSVNEIAAELKFPVNSVYRIMSTLERRSYAVKRNGESGYVLSDKLLGLATPVVGDASFIENAIPQMRATRDITKESMLAGVLLENEGVVLEQVEGLHNFSFKVNPGLRFPLHTAAPGKAFLAHLGIPDREKIVNGLDLKKFTANTIINPQAFLEEIEQVAKLGYAVDREEEMEGQVCVGSAVLNRNAELAGAIWLVAPTSRLPEKEIPRIGNLVKEAANKISSSLGCVFLQVA
jgi:DNA-binding IclR family transcriptional regulator